MYEGIRFSRRADSRRGKRAQHKAIKPHIFSFKRNSGRKKTEFVTLHWLDGPVLNERSCCIQKIFLPNRKEGNHSKCECGEKT